MLYMLEILTTMIDWLHVVSGMTVVDSEVQVLVVVMAWS